MAAIYHIYSGIFYKNKFAIGKDNNLLVCIPQDLKFFKNTTLNNIIVMGRKTWQSLPSPGLRGRVNIIVTNNPKEYESKFSEYDIHFMTPTQVVDYFRVNKSFQGYENVYVIGGAQLFKLFPEPQKIFITHIIPDTLNLVVGGELVFVDPPDNHYKLVGYSPEYNYLSNGNDVTGQVTTGGTFRHLIYKRGVSDHNINHTYSSLCHNIIERGDVREDRTGMGTYSIFGQHLRIDLQKGFPLLTTKYIPWKHVIQELLWFTRGDTDSKLLEEKGVKIWKGNTTREFLNSRGLDYDEGVLGKGYGWQWRFFGAQYNQIFADTSRAKPTDGFDQLEYVVNEIKTNPDSRRILMCYWNPCDLDKVALPPCHFSCQFYVRKGHDSLFKSDVKNIYKSRALRGYTHLDCMFTMRSTDVALGLPFNIASYAALTHIIAKKCGLEPGHLIYSGGDVHLYKNHIESIKLQLLRHARPLPQVILDDNIICRDWADITIDDFTLVGYFPHSAIKMQMAI